MASNRPIPFTYTVESIPQAKQFLRERGKYDELVHQKNLNEAMEWYAMIRVANEILEQENKKAGGTEQS